MKRLITKTRWGILIVLVSACVGCGDGKPDATPEEMIARSWKLEKLDMSTGEMVSPAIMGTSSFTFYKNGRYEILMGELERGRWSLSPNKTILITHAEGRPLAGEMDIVKLRPDLLILSNKGAQTPMTMRLVPVN